MDRTVQYTGTMTASSGWDLLDGTVTTEYDSARKVKIKKRDRHNPAGINYKGTCEPSPLLPLKPIYYNDADRAFAKPLTLSDYRYAAKAVANIYQKECPAVKDIRFSCTPMLQDYNDVIQAFARGDKKLLDQYKEFLRIFHNDWLEVYYYECGSYIKKPEKFTIKTIETRYDQFGVLKAAARSGRHRKYMLIRTMQSALIIFMVLTRSGAVFSS